MYTLCIRFREALEAERREMFFDVLSCWPSHSDAFRFQELDVGALLALQRSLGDRYELPKSGAIDKIREVANATPWADRAFVVDATWEVWQREFADHPYCRCVKGRRYPWIEYRGNEYSHTLGTIRVADETGDVAIGFDAYMAETSPYQDELTTEEEISKQRENVDVFLSFLTRVLE
jgi:hypothetical protein